MNIVNAQQKAVTETGDEVVLHEDGTWEYVNAEEVEEAKAIPVNKKKFKKDDKSTFLLKSKVNDYAVYINPKKWKFEKGESNDDAEYEMTRKGQDLYAMFIPERIEIPLEMFEEVAITNAQSVAPDIKVVEKEYRTVNGEKVLFMVMQGTLQGIKFVYYGYYASCDEGTVQFICYTSQNLLKDYRDDMDDLVNGLVRMKK